MKLKDRSETGIYCPRCKEEGRGAVKLIVRTNRDNVCRSRCGRH